MDRKKEETEPLDKQATSTTSTTKKATNISITPTDDDTTSTESSDTFETWTLVNDKEKKKLRDNLDDDDDSENRVEILKQSDDDEKDPKEEECKTEQEPQLKDSPNDVSNDDFSDGISIISESESVGRISPHPYIRDHLHDLNMKYSLSDHMDDTILNKMREDMENDSVPLQVQPSHSTAEDQQLRQRRRSTTPTADRDNQQALQKASQTVATFGGFAPLVKRGLQGIFYLGVGLALLGLIGKIVNPTWQPLASVVNSSPSTVELEQKVNDMELQNNLMRAEIDLLNKQVKHLSTLNDPQQQKPGKYKDYKESKTFKAWSGNGDTLKPVDITKQDLKKAYKCPDGSFVEIANMCMEQRPANEPSLVDQFGQVVGDLKEQSEAFKTFEQVAEELQGFQDNPFEQLQDILSESVDTAIPKKPFNKNKPIYETSKDSIYRPKGEDPNLSAPHKHNKYDRAEGKYDNNYKFNKDHKKSVGNDEYKHNREHKKYSGPESFRDNSKESNEWKSDKFGNNSKERKYSKNNSKERYSKDFDDSRENSRENQSKERYSKQKRKHNDDSGEWQENYMKHREQQREKNQQKYQDNKNWYIKRGDSRENKRIGDKQYR